MAVTKPSWLRNFLARWNFYIFTWYVPLGDTVEDAIDWALGWINWGIDQATLAYNRAIDAWNKAVEVWSDLISRLNRELAPVWSWIDTWGSRIRDWWSGVSSQVLAWVDQAKRYAADLVGDLRKLLNTLDTAWENFRRDTLPRLLDAAWVTSFFGRGISSIADWWATKAPWVRDTVETSIKPVRDEVNKRMSIFELAKQLLTDPLDWKDHFAEWVLGWLANILARVWSK